MSLHPSIRIEGGLLGPELFDQLLAADLPGQKPADFGLQGRRVLTDEIAAIFADARALWGVFQNRLARVSESDLATTVTRDAWMVPLLGLLGYEPQYNQRAFEVDGLSFAISHRASAADDAPPVHIVGARQDLGRLPPSGRPRMAPHSLVQEYLNRDDHTWGLVTNGLTLRLLRDSTFIRRQSYVEFDLAAIFDEQRFQDFAALYRLLHRTRLPKGKADAPDCLLEKYHSHSVEQGGRVREHLRDGVEECIKLLANGFLRHRDNGDLRRRALPSYAEADRIAPEAFFRQLLRLVYRFLFLLVSEDRGLLSADPLYREQYGIARLRKLTDLRSAYTDHDDLWQSLRVLWLVLVRDEAQPHLGGKTLAATLGLPVLNGELFQQQNLDECTISNRDLLAALWQLSFYAEGRGAPPRRVNYAALDVEELGSVYESLLEFHPALDPDAAGRPLFQLLSGSERKTTGSYYTPPELVNELIQSALVPVMQDRLAAVRKAHAKPTPAQLEKALLDIRVCDPACGSGHFLLAAARRLGKELASIRTGDDEPAPERVREAIRDIVAHCIYGVDKNPLAVDLCRVALWLESHTTDHPLTFLDHRIRCGDSLVGVADLPVLKEGIPDEAFKPIGGDDKAAAKEALKRDRQDREQQSGLFAWDPSAALEAFSQMSREVDMVADNQAVDIRRKRQLYEELQRRADWLRLKQACDLHTGAFFQIFRPGVPTITTGAVLEHLQGRSPGAQVLGMAMAMAIQHRFFHWPLEFPEVFAARDARGFDVLLGNPPWGAALSEGAKKLIRAEFASQQRGAIDTFAAFTEQAIHLSGKRARVGYVLPDIVLLKNYPAVRKFLLEQTAIERIAHWGRAFPAANIDVCTIALRLGEAPVEHEIACIPRVISNRIEVSPQNRIQQSGFVANKDYRFNLSLSPDTQALISVMNGLGPRVGSQFTIREGVHSGNVRAKLFLEQAQGDHCRPLIFGRDEIAPMRLRWAGKYIQLDPSCFDREAGDYFNLGESSLYGRDKLLVRRTGDYVLAAPDFGARYCSNNFFILVPHADCSREQLLYACAALNSRFSTLYFRTIQPRVGTLFAELKITHLEEIPLPFLNEPFAVEEGRKLLDVSERDGNLELALSEFHTRFEKRIAAMAPLVVPKLEALNA